uniref:Uncharacterized protein n=1 Tax=Plectus sambesii TaxID=2011161 RepID=A0A914X5H0_9BILA
MASRRASSSSNCFGPRPAGKLSAKGFSQEYKRRIASVHQTINKFRKVGHKFSKPLIHTTIFNRDHSGKLTVYSSHDTFDALLDSTALNKVIWSLKQAAIADMYNHAKALELQLAKEFAVLLEAPSLKEAVKLIRRNRAKAARFSDERTKKEHVWNLQKVQRFRAIQRGEQVLYFSHRPLSIHDSPTSLAKWRCANNQLTGKKRKGQSGLSHPPSAPTTTASSAPTPLCQPTQMCNAASSPTAQPTSPLSEQNNAWEMSGSVFSSPSSSPLPGSLACSTAAASFFADTIAALPFAAAPSVLKAT